MTTQPRKNFVGTLTTVSRDREEGAFLVEAAPALAVFLLCLFFLIELCRFTYLSLTSEFLVIEAARFASIVGIETVAGTDPVDCCNERVNRIKDSLVNAAQNDFYYSLNPATEIFICAVTPDGFVSTCDICNGPGFRRSSFLQIQINRPVGMFTWVGAGRDMWTVKRRALTKTESQIMDCPV